MNQSAHYMPETVQTLQGFLDSRFWERLFQSRSSFQASLIKTQGLGFKKFFQNLESWIQDSRFCQKNSLNLESQELCKLCKLSWCFLGTIFQIQDLFSLYIWTILTAPIAILCPRICAAALLQNPFAQRFFAPLLQQSGGTFVYSWLLLWALWDTPLQLSCAIHP